MKRNKRIFFNNNKDEYSYFIQIKKEKLWHFLSMEWKKNYSKNKYDKKIENKEPPSVIDRSSLIKRNDI